MIVNFCANTMESFSGHLVGMLDRDQRTAKLRFFNRHLMTTCEDLPHSSPNLNQNTVSHQEKVPRRTSLNAKGRTPRNGHFWNSLQRLKHVLIVGFYLSFVTFPSIYSAPTNRKVIMSSRLEEHPKWINPCGIRSDNGALAHHETEIRQISDVELLTQIIDQANIAYSKANQFKEDFVQKTFNTNSEQLHNQWKDSHYEWLPTIEQVPKGLGQHVPKEHLIILKLETTLLNSYEHLQKVAVGLEQIVWDQQEEHGPFEVSFKEAEHNLRNLLCELQMAIYEHNIKMRPDITRDIMTNELRKMDNTSTNLRNWLIYRDYMNILEYVIESFDYLKTKL